MGVSPGWDHVPSGNFTSLAIEHGRMAIEMVNVPIENGGDMWESFQFLMSTCPRLGNPNFPSFSHCKPVGTTETSARPGPLSPQRTRWSPGPRASGRRSRWHLLLAGSDRCREGTWRREGTSHRRWDTKAQGSDLWPTQGFSSNQTTSGITRQFHITSMLM